MLYKIKVWRTFHRKDTTQIQNTKIKIKVFCPKTGIEPASCGIMRPT